MTDLEIFHNAPDAPSPEELAAYLDEACGDDTELRARVESLFGMAQRTDDFLEEEVFDPDAPTIGPEGQVSGKAHSSAAPVEPFPKIAHEEANDVIGPFTLLEKLGEGGFGSVWKAEQKVPIARTVALKIIKLGMDTQDVLTRFEAERQALAMMNHENIAKVLDAGATENGRPYFVMELVDGLPITTFCDENHLDTHQRLALFQEVCAAVNHAHQKGLIHRDIKPSNVMVTEQDGTPVVKVIDFGIAKATEGKLTEETLVTLQEQVIGTPAYMSPEQAGMAGYDIDTRSDIYSLGVLLYELLAGKPPFDPKTLLAAGFDEMRRIVREEEPPRPSHRVSTISDAEETITLSTTHGAEPQRLSRILRGDLDWIVMKAIEKDRGMRYETANAFVADIERFLANEPVSAAAPTLGYQFRKFARRNRTALAVGSTIAAVLVVATVVSVRQAIRANLAQQTAEERSEELQHQLYDSDMILASQAMEGPGGLTSALAITEKWIPKEGERDLRGWEWYWQRSSELANTESFFFPCEADETAIADLKWFPDSQRFLAWAAERVVVWNFKTKMRLARIENQGSLAKAVAIHPEGDQIAIAWDNNEITIHLADNGEETMRFSPPNEIDALTWVASHSHLITAGLNGIEFWDAETGESTETPIPLPIGKFPTFSPDGEKLAFLDREKFGQFQAVQTASGESIHTSKIEGSWYIRRIRWSPSGRFVTAVMIFGNTYHLDLKEDIMTREPRLTGKDLAWMGRRNIIVVAPQVHRAIELRSGSDSENLLEFWNTGEEQAELLSSSPDGNWILSCEGIGNRIRAWSTHPSAKVPLIPERTDETIDKITWTPPKKQPPGKELKLGWNRQNPGIRTDIDFWWSYHRASAAWHPDGSRLALLNRRGGYDLEIWNEETGLVEHQRKLAGAIRHIEWNDDGSRLVIFTHTGYWMVCDGESLQEFWRIPRFMASATWLPGDQGLVMSKDDELWIAHPDTGETIRKIVVRPEVRRAKELNEYAREGRMKLAVSPDGSQLACASLDQTVSIWDTKTWEPLRTLWHGQPVLGLAWNPTGDRLVTGTEDSIRIWDPARGAEVLRRFGIGAEFISWSPDGMIIASGNIGSSLAHLWDIRPARRAEQHERFEEAVDARDWSAASIAALTGLTKYQRAIHDPWFHAGWWQQISPDSGAKPKSASTPGSNLSAQEWMECPTTPDGVVDASGNRSGPARRAYLSRYYVADETTATLCIDIPVPGRIRLGDQDIYESEAGQPIGRLQEKATLTPGWNDFYVHLEPAPATAEFQLRLAVSDAASKPFSEIEQVPDEPMTEEDRRQRVQATIEAAPDDATAWRNLVKVELHHRNPDRAATALRRAFDLDPDHFDATALLARLLLLQTKTAETGNESVSALLDAIWALRIIHAAEAGFFPRIPPSQVSPGPDGTSPPHSNPFLEISLRQPSETEIAAALQYLATWLPDEERSPWLNRWSTAFAGDSNNKLDPETLFRCACVQQLSGNYEAGRKALQQFSEHGPRLATTEVATDTATRTKQQKVDRIYDLTLDEMLLRFQALASRSEPESAREALDQAIRIVTATDGTEPGRNKRAHAMAAWALPLGDQAGLLLEQKDFDTATPIGHCLTLYYSEDNLDFLQQLEPFQDTDHTSIGYTLLKLSNQSGDRMERDEKIALQESARRIALLDPESHLLLYVDQSLGNEYAEAERHEEARAARQSALELARKYKGDDDGFTLALLWSLGRSQEKTGHYREAVALARELVDRNLKIHGPDHHHTIAAQRELVRYLEGAGDTDDAEDLRATLPQPYTEELKNDVQAAIDFAEQGQHESAVQRWRALRPIIASLSLRDQVTALSGLRIISRKLNAERIYPEDNLAIRQAFLEACESFHGPDYHQTLYGKIGLAEYLETQQRLDEAIALRREAIEKAVEHNYPEPEFFARQGLANILQRTGKYEEALSHYRPALSYARENRGSEDAMTRGILGNLVYTLEKAEYYEEAIELGDELLDWRIRYDGLEQEATRRAIKTLARCHDEIGQAEKAALLRKKLSDAQNR